MSELDLSKITKSGDILAIGSLERESGFDLLIHSWVGVNKPLEIIGSGSQEKILNELIKSLRLESLVYINSIPSDKLIAEKLRVAKGLIIPSLEKEDAFLLQEAIKNEVPILGTQLPQISKLIPREFLCEAGSVQELGALLEEMIPLLPQFNLQAIKQSLKT
jgi:glycosyltransferase involved in cell wall biosynthesis